MMKLLACIVFKVILLQNVLSQSSVLESPCPEIFRYDSSDTGKWYGTIFAKSNIKLYGIWIDLILDKTAESIDNSLGDVETFDYLEFKIKSKNQILNENTLLSITIGVKYNPLLFPPKITAIRLNGRQICTESDSNVQPQTINQNHRSVNQYSSSNKNTNQSYFLSNPRNERNWNVPLPLGVNDSFNNRQGDHTKENSRNTNYNEIVSYRPIHTETSQRPVYHSSNRESIDTFDRSRYDNSNTRLHEVNSRTNTQNNYNARSNTRYATTTTRPTRTYKQDKKSDLDYDYGESSMKRDRNNDYFEGDFHLPQESKIDPTPLPSRSLEDACGVVAIQPAPLIVGGQTTTQGQWPWHVAIYQSQTVDSKYICGGSLITTSHVITAAHCVTRKNSVRLVNAQTLTVYLGKYNLRKSSDSVQITLVKKIFVHPQYNYSNFYADLAVLKFTKPCDYTIYVRPVCLWKESETELSYVIEKDGTVVGWGFDEDGHVTEDLTLVKMPVVKQSTCLWSFREFYTHFTSEKSYCAGYENGTSVCNGDSGGGMVFPDNKNQENVLIWRLRGLVSISVAKQNEFRCDPYHYVVFTDLAQFLDWIKEKLIL